MKTTLHLLAAATLILAATACKKEQPDICPDCPIITNIAPASGAPGTLVTIRGINFEGLEYVVFDDDTQLPVVPDSTTATKTSIVAPDLAKNGPVKVTVIRKFSSGGGGTFSLESKEDITFTYLQGPEISGFSPQTGKKGDIITLTGRFFGANPEVFFPNGEAAEYLVRSDTLIQVTAPAKAGNGPLSVTSAGLTGTSAANYTHQYKFKVDLFLGQPGQPGFVINVPASEARLENITHIAADGEGNVYIVNQYDSDIFDVLKIDKEPPHMVTVIVQSLNYECKQLLVTQNGVIYTRADKNLSPGWTYRVTRYSPGSGNSSIYGCSTGFCDYFPRGIGVDENGIEYFFMRRNDGNLPASLDGIYQFSGSNLTKLADVVWPFPHGNVYTINNKLFYYDEAGVSFFSFDIASKLVSELYDLPLFSGGSGEFLPWTYSPFLDKIYFQTSMGIRAKETGSYDIDEQHFQVPGLESFYAGYMGSDSAGNLFLRRWTELPCLYKATLE